MNFRAIGNIPQILDWISIMKDKFWSGNTSSGPLRTVRNVLLFKLSYLLVASTAITVVVVRVRAAVQVYLWVSLPNFNQILGG